MTASGTRGYALRPAAEQDAAAVAACVDAAYRHYIERIGRPPGPMTEDYARVLRERQVTVAEGAGRVVGVLVLSAGAEGFLLENVAVDPSLRGTGLGRALLELAEAEARRAGFDSIYLYTHEKMTENRALYARIGYVEYDRRFEKGLARVYMRKSLVRMGVQPQRGGNMANKMTDLYLGNNKQYASGQAVHKPGYPGKQPINPAKHVAVVACMDARLDVEDLLGLQTGDAHIIRNAGGVVTDDAIRCLIISHHLLNTNEIILIHHTRCGMLAFTDDLLKAGLEGDPAAEKLLGQATSRAFMSCKKCASTPSQFHAFRGAIEPLDAPRNPKQTERLEWDVRRGMSAILNHPWIPTSGPDAVTVRGFIYDVDTGKLEEVSYPGAMGSIG